MRIIVKPQDFRFPIPILFPSLLVFNHITAVIGLLILLIARISGAKWSKSLPLPPWKCFCLFHRFILGYWMTRIRCPGWKMVEVQSDDADVTIKL
ncbi:MAG: hypothetical protein E7604_09985 [Ruminococcaceae bacterium]|nr:hypothetical protein [Oscillospiraceae bacterium]